MNMIYKDDLQQFLKWSIDVISELQAITGFGTESYKLMLKRSTILLKACPKVEKYLFKLYCITKVKRKFFIDKDAVIWKF